MPAGGPTDPFESDDFEFQPLTEGLGFHKKAEKLKADVRATPLSLDITASVQTMPESPASTTRSRTSTASNNSRKPDPSISVSGSRSPSQSISDLIASLPPSLDFVDEGSRVPASPRPQIYQPLAPRDDYKTASSSSSAAPTPAMGPTIGSVLPTPGSKAGGVSTAAAIAAPLVSSSPYRDKMNESFAKAFPHAEPRTPARETRTSTNTSTSTGTSTGTAARTQETTEHKLGTAAQNMPGAILDSMVVLGISTIFLVCILAITHVNLVALLTNANTDVATRFHLGLLFVAVLQMYLLTARSFFGASLGEWAFDLKLGTEDQRRQTIYPLQVAWRTLLMTVTGFVVVPVLSLVFRKDLARPLTGLELIRQP